MREEIETCLTVLRRGGVILCPTETVWGLSCDATNENAVKRIFEIKKREESKSLVTLVDSQMMLNKFVDEVPSVAWDIIETADRPITIIYDGACGLAGNVVAEDGSAGIRITSNEFCKMLIRKFGKPIVSTSANISGEDPPKGSSDIPAEILSAVDHVVNLPANNSSGMPSTIIKIKKGGLFTIIRK